MKEEVRYAFDLWLSELDAFEIDGPGPMGRWFPCYRREGIDFLCDDMSLEDLEWFINEAFKRYQQKLSGALQSFQFYVWFDTFNLAMSAIDSVSAEDLPFGGKITVCESLEPVFLQLQELERYGILSFKGPHEEPPEVYDESRVHITMVYRRIHT